MMTNMYVCCMSVICFGGLRVLSISYNRMDSGPGDMKTESKRQVEKMEVSF